jgi:hypothetical protein
MPRVTEEKPLDIIRYLGMDRRPVKGEIVNYYYELTDNSLSI